MEPDNLFHNKTRMHQPALWYSCSAGWNENSFSGEKVCAATAWPT